MIREIIKAFRGPGPDGTMAAELEKMLELAHEMVVSAGTIYWDAHAESAGRDSAVHRRDLDLNELQRHLRERLLTRLAACDQLRPARLLVMMSVLKDVERLGDYAKNLVELAENCPNGPPAGAGREALLEVRETVEGVIGAVKGILEREDEEAARHWIERGKAASRRCTELVAMAARHDGTPAEAVSLALGARYYKRIQSHLLNILSSVVVPLPQLDYTSAVEDVAA